MGEIATLYRQITLFYDSKSVRAKKTLANAKAEIIKQPIALTTMLLFW